MTALVDELLSSYRSLLERHRNRPFLRGAMAACALVASADGQVSFAERMRVDQVLTTLERLRVFDPHEGVELFGEYSEAIFAAPKAGREHALAAVRAASGDGETADLLVRICLAVLNANPASPLVAQIEVVMLCNLLGIEPDNAALYTGDPARLEASSPDHPAPCERAPSSGPRPSD